MASVNNTVTTITHDNICIFNVCDALQLTLHKVGTRVQGFDPKRYSVGGFWDFNADLVVCSDSIKAGEAAFFAAFGGNLWAYIVSSKQGLFLAYFDGSAAHAKVGSTHLLTRGNHSDTFKSLLPHVKDTFRFDETTKQWVSSDVANLVPGK